MEELTFETKTSGGLHNKAFGESLDIGGGGDGVFFFLANEKKKRRMEAERINEHARRRDSLGVHERRCRADPGRWVNRDIGPDK